MSRVSSCWERYYSCVWVHTSCTVYMTFFAHWILVNPPHYVGYRIWIKISTQITTIYTWHTDPKISACHVNWALALAVTRDYMCRCEELAQILAHTRTRTHTHTHTHTLQQVESLKRKRKNYLEEIKEVSARHRKEPELQAIESQIQGLETRLRYSKKDREVTVRRVTWKKEDVCKETKAVIVFALSSAWANVSWE